MPCLPNDFPGAVTTVPVLKNFMSLETEDVVAEEVPVALVYNGISHTVMMASPVMLEEFGTGFSLTEGIVESVSDIYDVEVIEACGSGREVRITISSKPSTTSRPAAAPCSGARVAASAASRASAMRFAPCPICPPRRPST